MKYSHNSVQIHQKYTNNSQKIDAITIFRRQNRKNSIYLIQF